MLSDGEGREEMNNYDERITIEQAGTFRITAWVSDVTLVEIAPDGTTRPIEIPDEVTTTKVSFDRYGIVT